jgi:hypothetical protein
MGHSRTTAAGEGAQKFCFLDSPQGLVLAAVQNGELRLVALPLVWWH